MFASYNFPPPPNNRQNFRLVGDRFIKGASPGLAIGLLVLGAVIANWGPGARASANDLFAHTAFINPFLLSLVIVLTSIAVLVHGADSLEFADEWLLLPFLKFFSHALPVAAGAFIPIALCNLPLLGSTPGGIALNIGIWQLELTLFGTMAIIGCLIVEQRIAAAGNPLAGRAPRIASNLLLKGYVLLLILSLWVMFKSLSTPGSTEASFSGWVHMGSDIANMMSKVKVTSN